MFGRDSEDAKLQKALRLAGADPVVVKNWFKTLERMRKTAPSVRTRYEEAHRATEELVAVLEQMERLLLGENRVLPEPDRQLLSDLRKQMKQLQGKCDHSFVVSPDDREFHSTFDVLLRLEPGKEINDEDTLILQSEIENLLASARESLDREPPSLVWLCYYSVNRSGRELEKLPPEERLAKLRRVYQNEFVERMRTILTDCIQEACRMRESSGRVDRGMEILLTREPKERSAELRRSGGRKDFEEQADAFLVALCDMGV